MLVLDFETRSSLDLKKVGLSNYIACPYFDVTVAVVLDTSTGEVHVGDTPETIHAFLAPMLAQHRLAFVAHNAIFEFCVCEVLARRWGLNPPGLERFYCTSAMASKMGLPAKLDRVSGVLFGTAKQADGETLINTFGRLNKQGSFNTKETHPEQWERYVSYCIQDVQLTARLAKVLRPLSPEERERWVSVARMNLIGFAVDMEAVKRILSDVALIQADSAEELRALTDDSVSKPTETQKFKNWLLSKGHDVENTTMETLDELIQDPELPDPVRWAILARREGSRATFGKYRAYERYTSADGRSRHGFWYYGAHTGRLSGKGVQPQNMGKGTLENISASECLEMYLTGTLPPSINLTDALIAMLRAVVVASPGCRLYIADYAAIEARIVVWLAGHDELVEMYRQGADLYKPMAAEILRIPVEQVTKAQRNERGKITILGCGYGLGREKFAKKNNLSMADGEACRAAYRTRYFKVPVLWQALEDAFVATLVTGRPTEVSPTMARLGGKNYPGAPVVRFEKKGRYIVCTPPGGRQLFYRDVERDTDGRLTCVALRAVGSYRKNIWGGVLLENICQNIAGTIIAIGMLQLEKLGAVPVLQVHDEAVAELPEWIEDLKPYDAALVNVAGFTGLPLAVESKVAYRYGK